MEQILDFYRQTSMYTDLGCYREWAKTLPDDLGELCVLQRKQIIHPVAFYDPDIRKQKEHFYGDMTKVPVTRLNFEDEVLPTAVSMVNELLRRDSRYSADRRAENKIHVTCRCQAILLAAVLKAKEIPARVRSGFAPYIRQDGICCDHWITEYYNEKEECWILADADIHCAEQELGFDPKDIPADRYLTGGQAYLAMRRAENAPQLLYASVPPTLGMKAALRGLFYDFHALMNDEVTFLLVPKYVQEKDFELSEEEYLELDTLAELLLDPDRNFKELRTVWDTRLHYRLMAGALNG